MDGNRQENIDYIVHAYAGLLEIFYQEADGRNGIVHAPVQSSPVPAGKCVGEQGGPAPCHRGWKCELSGGENVITASRRTAGLEYPPEQETAQRFATSWPSWNVARESLPLPLPHREAPNSKNTSLPANLRGSQEFKVLAAAGWTRLTCSR